MKKVFVWTVAVGLAMIAGSAFAGEAKPAEIDRNGVLILIRSTLLALDHANKTGNYTVLRDLGSPAFQVNTASHLSDIFANERREKLDLSGVAALDPQLTVLPEIETNGMLHMVGLFPSVPSQVKFELLYAPVEGQWRLYGLLVSLAQSGPAPRPGPSASRLNPTLRPNSNPRQARGKSRSRRHQSNPRRRSSRRLSFGLIRKTSNVNPSGLDRGATNNSFDLDRSINY